MKEFGQILKELRLEKKLSQEASTLNGALLSGIFGSVTSAVGMTIDIIRNRKNQKQKVVTSNQLYAYCF